MSGSLNRVMLIGNLGADPEIRSMQSGDQVCNLSIATSESWKDKNTGEKRENVQWHKVVIFNQGLIKVCQNYLKKGSKVFIEGQLETRSWEQDGQKKYTTEIVLRNFGGTLTMLDGKSDNPNSDAQKYGMQAPQSDGLSHDTFGEDFEDSIPF